ncbi:MAG: A/G-specific adenine glycosylase [Candidatus Promineifilaceae bacterium]|jgi:A/G-specific adenine glycosylase
MGRKRQTVALPQSPMPRWVLALLRWFNTHRRAMPWRDVPSPYAVWISEMMLQQTQVETVIPYFDRFIARFPDVATLAEADQDAVLKLWEGLGYYSRARSLHRAAQAIVEQHNGLVPDRYETLLSLPGIGPYTAAAIASIAFDQATPSVDGNVLRVVSRFRGMRVDIKAAGVADDIRSYLSKRIPRSSPGDFNQALMELGALVCRPKNALCGQCPLRPSCKAAQQNAVSEIPLKVPRAKVPHVDVLALVVLHRGRYLLVKRKESKMLGGLWEFPGGKREPGETLAAAAARTCCEASGVTVVPVKKLGILKHAYSHFKITLHVFEASRTGGRIRAGGDYSSCEWVQPLALAQRAMPITARRVVNRWLTS